MEKPKVRRIVGWRERESQVRRNRLRMRASAGAFKAVLDASGAKKKTEPVA